MYTNAGMGASTILVFCSIKMCYINYVPKGDKIVPAVQVMVKTLLYSSSSFSDERKIWERM